MEIKFNPDDLTLGEAEEFEEYAGITVASLSRIDAANTPTKVLTAMLYVARKRENPSITWAEVRALKFSEFSLEVPRPNVAAPAAEASA